MVTFRPPLVFQAECCPRALAAVAGITGPDAASILWPLRGLWWDARRSRPAGSGLYGTAEHAVGDALARIGLRPELWSGDGDLLADSVTYGRFLRHSVHDRAVGVRRHRGSRPAPASPQEPEEPTGRVLAEWLEAHRGGGWWVPFVGKDDAAHALATYGGTVKAGDGERYLDWRVYLALRAFPTMENDS